MNFFKPADENLFKVSKITLKQCSFEHFPKRYFADYEQVFVYWETNIKYIYLFQKITGVDVFQKITGVIFYGIYLYLLVYKNYCSNGGLLIFLNGINDIILMTLNRFLNFSKK